MFIPRRTRRLDIHRPRVESLERRTLLAFSPLGAEFRVNTTTVVQLFPAAASDADGDSVVVWMQYAPDFQSTNVRAQRFGAAGAAEGGEILVNTTGGYRG